MEAGKSSTDASSTRAFSLIVTGSGRLTLRKKVNHGN